MRRLSASAVLAWAIGGASCAAAPTSTPLPPRIAPIDASAASDASTDDAGVAAAVDAPAPSDAGSDPSREPQTIATGLDAIDTIALDDDDVYVLAKLPSVWRLSRVSKRGGPVTRLDDFHAEAVSLAVDDRNFYVATALKISEAIQGGNFRTSAYGRVIAASKVGGSRATIADGLRAAYGVDVHGANVFWLSGTVDYVGTWSVDAVMRGRASGGGATFVAMKQSGATSVAADDANVYFTVAGRFDDKTHAWPPGAVMRAPIAGTNATTLVTTGEHPRAIAVDDAAVYWIERAGALMRVAKAGGAASSIADGVEHFVLDGARVVWTKADAIVVTPKSGGDGVAKLTAASSVSAIALDAAFVYYAAGGELRRAPK